MATNEKELNKFRNLEIFTLILYFVGLVENVVQVRYFDVIVLSYTFSDLVEEGYMDEAMMVPLYLAMVTTFIAIITATTNEPYFKISALFSAILPIITLFSLHNAINKLKRNLGPAYIFGFGVSGSYDIGTVAIIAGIILSLYAGLKYKIQNGQEHISTLVQHNIRSYSKNDLVKQINPPQGESNVQNNQIKDFEVSAKNALDQSFCSNCANEIVEENYFCVRCGIRVED